MLAQRACISSIRREKVTGVKMFVNSTFLTVFLCSKETSSVIFSNIRGAATGENECIKTIDLFTSGI